MENKENIVAQGANSNGGTPCEATDALARLVADKVVRAIEAKYGEAFKALSLIAPIRTAAVASRRDVSIIMRKLAGATGLDPDNVEVCTLIGTKRAQFLHLCELRKAKPQASLRSLAREAIHKVGGKDGYYSDVALSEYAAKHRTWWERKENEDNGGNEEVVR